MIERKMLPNQVPLTWTEFVKWAPPYSMALDGFVAGKPRFMKRGPYRNLNHHEDVAALETRATCAQALMLIRAGLVEEVFSLRGTPRVTLFVNDCDEDVCTADFLFHNLPLVRSTMNPLLNRLVYMEDMLDTTAGAYPFPTDLPSLRELMWVFEPYHRFRASGQLDQRDASAFEGVVVEVGHRIKAHILGKGGQIDIDPRYEVIGGGKGWRMIKTVGIHGATGAFADGLRAFVTMRERPDGRFVYSLRRTADFIDALPIPRIVRIANQVEKCSTDRWGGRTTASGSPRVGGSRQNPDELARLIASCQYRS